MPNLKWKRGKDWPNSGDEFMEVMIYQPELVSDLERLLAEALEDTSLTIDAGSFSPEYVADLLHTCIELRDALDHLIFDAAPFLLDPLVGHWLTPAGREALKVWEVGA